MSRQPVKIISSFLLLCFVVLGAAAQTPTSQQIEQFKRLPRAQQEQLARQLGFDLSQLSGSGSAVSQSNPNTQSQEIYPRGTRFDEFGNPIQEDMLVEPEEEDELTLYGLDLFASEPTSFTPVTNVPVPADYLIGPGDELFVQLYGKENEEYRLQVGRDGRIVIPKLGPYAVASMRFAEVKGFLTEQIKKQVIGVEVSVSMGQLRSMRVFVMGEAYKPGAYNVSSLSTITNALFVSGGVSEIASLRNVQLKRAGKLVTTLDLYDLLNAGDSSNDVQLQAGDVVFIPAVTKTVTIDGQVRRPAIYELKNEQTLSEVIKLAGGKLPEGFDQAISVKRYINGTQMQLTGDLSRQDLQIAGGDYITVPKVSPFVSNSVTLIGAVARPGKYQWYKGLSLSNLLGSPQKDLLEHADLTYVLILRDKNVNRDIEVLQADLTQLTGNPAKQDIELQSNDRVLVFSKVENRVFADIELEELAYSEDVLDENAKQAWDKRIEEKLFWRSVGLGEEVGDDFEDEELALMQNRSVIELTDDEKERVLEFKNTTYFSRKRMLAPVITKLRDQAKFGDPIQLVEVSGEVKVQGTYPLTKGARINDLLKAAGGLTESSYAQRSEITRTKINQRGVTEVEHLGFSPRLVSTGSEGNIALKSRDRINIFSTPSWQEDLTVSVKGEVEFPGEYTIKRGETLSELINRVGGLTAYGDQNAAVFTRESLKIRERENLQKLAEELRKQIASESLRRQSGGGSIVSYDEAKKLLRDLTKAEPVGRLVVDLAELIERKPGSDIALEDGDKLYIPSLSQSVNVVGEVYVPTSHLYVTGLSYEEYILRSGGYRRLADQSNTYIVRANGAVEVPGRDSSFWFSGSDNSTAIHPGDTIVVPFDTENIDNITLWTNATQILYQLAISVAAIGSL